MDEQDKINYYKLERKIDSVLELLKGNELDASDTGLAGTVRDINKRVRKLERLRDRFAWVVVGASAISGWGLGGVISKLADVVTKLFKS